MKRSRRGGGTAQAEACDVWLDTAERKQSSVQSFIAKPKVSSRGLDRKVTSFAFTQSRACQPRTKQTIISTFFHTQTDEKDKENSRPSPFTLKKDSKEKGISLAASPLKILTLPQVEEARNRSFRAGEGKVQVTLQHRAGPAPASCLSQAGSHGRSKASCGLGEDSCSFSFTQDSEGSQTITHRQEPDLFAGEMASASSSETWGCRMYKGEGQLLPETTKTRLKHGANQRKTPSRSSSIHPSPDSSGTENDPPPPRRDSSCAARLASSPHTAAGVQPLRERSQNAAAGSALQGQGTEVRLSSPCRHLLGQDSEGQGTEVRLSSPCRHLLGQDSEGQGTEVRLSSPCRHLFSLDSEGNRVIAHCCWHLPSPCQEHGSSGGQLPSSPDKGWASDAAERSWSKLGEQDSEVCYDLLFTQDSEGNRVIKHEVASKGSSHDLL